MKAFSALLIAIASAKGTLASSSSSALLQAGEKCTNPLIRREWRSLSVDERKKYIDAVQCMLSKPARHSKEFPIVKTRYEDFVALHVNATQGGLELADVLASMPGGGNFSNPPQPGVPFANHNHDTIHGTGNFLAWHRYAITLWEDTLISECGWKGGIPYWNWHLDTPDGGGSFNDSPLFDSVSGFGGNGKKVNNSTPNFPMPPGFKMPKLPEGLMIPGFGGTGGGCVTNGPFVNITLRIGPLGKMTLNNTRCLTRDFNPKLTALGASKKAIAKVLGAKTFLEFQNGVERAPGNFSLEALASSLADGPIGDFHAAGHGGVGGEMMDILNSVNDPIFFQHHAAIDYYWALWQEQNQTRLQEFSARTADGGRTALNPDSPLWMGVFAPEKQAREVMDTRNRNSKGILCYKYEGLPIEKYSS